MRILAISNYYPPFGIGSYELQCLQVSHQLTRRGHNVRILTSKGGGHEPVGLHQSTRVVRDLELFPESNSEPATFNRLYRRVKGNQKVLQEKISTFLPDVIMLWGMEGLPLAVPLTAERSGIPCVYALYDHWLGQACEKDPWWKYWNEEDAIDPPIIRNILKRLRLEDAIHNQAPCGGLEALQLENVYFCSDSLKNETTRSCKVPFDRAMVIPCGIKADDIRPKPAGSALGKRLLYVARLSEEKDPMTAIRAVEELRRQGEDGYSLDIYGKGTPEFEAALHDYVRRYQISGTVSFRPMAEEQVRNAIPTYDMLLFTSKYPEPFPLVHLKAMAARIPVISTLEGGTGELVRDGINGFAFETSNHYDLAAKIKYVSENPGLTEKVVETAYQDVVQRYSMERVTSRVESLLHRAAHTEGVVLSA